MPNTTPTSRMFEIAIISAQGNAKKRQDQLRLGDYLIGLINLDHGTSFLMLKKMGTDLPTLRRFIEDTLKKPEPGVTITPILSVACDEKDMTDLAEVDAAFLNSSFIETNHLLTAIISAAGDPLAKALAGRAIPTKDLLEELMKIQEEIRSERSQPSA